MDEAEPIIRQEEEIKGAKDEKVLSHVPLPSASNGNGATAVEPAAPSEAPPAVKLESLPEVNVPSRSVLAAPGLPLVRPPFNPSRAGGPLPRPVGAAGAMPLGLPPGLAPALRGASPAQIAEMIAAARQIQQQRLLQQMQHAATAGTGGAAGAPRPIAPLANIPAPSGQVPRPFVVTARPVAPAGGTGEAGPSTLAAAAHAGSLPPQQGNLLPSQPVAGSGLKRKSEDLTPAPGVAMGFPGNLGPGVLGHPPAAPAIAAVAAAAAAPGLSEEVATSAGEQQPPPGAAPAVSVSAHFTYGNSGELYGDDGSGGSGAGLDADGKKVRLVWTQELHNRFINALSHLGLKHAVPKNILTMMNVEGMTRENVASHLQKYRLYLKKIGGHSEKDRVDADALQALHEQNVQHMAAQQAMQQSMAAVTGAGGYHQQHVGGRFMAGLHHAPQHQYTTSGGLDNLPLDPTAAAPMGAHPGVNNLQNISGSGGGGGGGNGGSGGSGGHPSGNANNGGGGGPPMIYIAPGDIVEGIPVSDIPVPEPVSPTVTAALEAGGNFNPQGWQYPPMVMNPENHHQLPHPSSRIPPSGAVMGLPHQQGGGRNEFQQHHRQQLQPQQQQQYHQFDFHQQHHSNLGDLAAAAAAGGEHGHEPSPAVWTDNGEGWAEGWPIHQDDDADAHAHADGGVAQGSDENELIQTDGGGGGGGAKEGEAEGVAGTKKGSPGTGTHHSGDGNGGGGSGGVGGASLGNNNNDDNAVVVVVDDDNEDPPLIPAVPGAGELHHMVERVPMRMADSA